MKPSERIPEEAVENAKKRLGSEFGYMGGVNEADYIYALLPVLDELSERIEKLEADRVK